MSTLGNAGRVGLVVLIGAALFGGMWAFFLQQSVLNHTYTLDVLFDDASGITKDAPVQLAGVQIGTVDDVTLTPSHKADIRLKINDMMEKRPVRIPRGSQFVVSTPILGATGVLTIVPPADAAKRPDDIIRPDAANLVGARTGDLSASLTRANALIDQLTATAHTANMLLANDQLQHNLRQTVANVDAATAGGAQLTAQLSRSLDEDNAQIKALLQQTRAGTQASLNNIAAATGQIKGLTTENRAQLDAIVTNLRDTTSAVAGITSQANDLLSKGDVSRNLSLTVANLKTTTEKLSAAASNLQSLTGDAGVQSNLKQTVQNVRQTTEEASLLLARLNKLAGTKRPKTAAVVVTPGGGVSVIVPPGAPSVTVPSVPGSAVPLFLPRVDLTQNTRSNHFRADVDAVVPFGTAADGTFGRAGIYGVGDESRVILQYGKSLGRGGVADARGGLYASKLGVGGDIGLGQRQTLSFELYDPNRFHLDARGVIKLAPALGLIVGAENIPRRSGPLIGLEYHSTTK